MRAILAGFVLAVAGCGVDLPPPAPDSVVPAYGYNGADTFVSIGGKHFYPQVEVDASTRHEADVDDSFVVTLERDDVSWPLGGVALRDYHNLEAVVPAGIPAGTWDVVVASPGGASGRLVDGFEVTDTLADHLRMATDEVSFEVFESASVLVELVDPAGAPVFDALDVVVEVQADDGDAGVAFAEGSLVDQVPLSDGSGIRGRLANDGRARIALTVSTPDLVTITVSPQNLRSGIAEDVLLVEWLPGPPSGLEISLPEEPVMRVVAGEAFTVGVRVIDDFGNTVDEPKTVLLRDQCATGWFSKPTNVVGSAVLSVALTSVAPDDCPENRLVNALGEGESSVIEVAPAALHHFDVDIGSGLVLPAGAELFAEVVPQDMFGNARSYSGVRLEVDDTAGGVSTYSCNPFEKKYFCRAAPVSAGVGLRLRVTGDAAIAGESGETFTVVAAAPTALDVDIASASVAAGTAVTATVTMTDAWGNIVGGGTIPSSAYLFADGAGPVSCALSGLAPSGAAEFACKFTTAADATALQVSVPTHGLLGASGPLQVVNGPLSYVEVVPAAYSVAAGQALSVRFDAFDAYGNPYVVKTAPTLDITDTSKTLSLKVVTLAGAGSASAVGTFERAQLTSVIASQGGVELGRSTAISITAGAAAALEVSPDVPWAWVGEPTPVSVRAVDAFGNPAALDGVATVSARSGGAAPALVTLAGGAGSATVTWNGTHHDEVLDASSGSRGGASPAFAVVQDCGGSGPTAALDLGGRDHAIACYDPTAEEAELVASMAASTGATEYRAAVAGEEVVTGTSSALTLTASAMGRFDLRALALDASLCGSEVVTDAWIGPDDGTAVGPLALGSSVSEIAAGAGRATITLAGAITCTGDPASGAAVNVRADRGVITGGAASGAGLAVTLDAAGEGEVTLDATSVRTGGVATVHAGVGAGQAYGALEIDVTGDSARPTVWDSDPRGETSGSVSAIRLTFSEPLLASTVVASNFTVTGPVAASVSSVGASAGGDEVTLTLASPIDAGLGTWTVTAVSSASGAALRDESGNRLDGTWTGTASTWTGTFGAVPSAVRQVTGCAPSRTAFRPDGDDGAGREADLIDVAITSASAPVWWVVSVSSAEGDLVRRDYVAPLGASDVWSWDGRDGEERVVDDGIWTIAVDTDDGAGNRGGSCTATVTVDNGTGG